MPSPSILFVIVIAVVGWMATIRAVSTSRLSERAKRWMLIPSWIPWMIVALGAPLFTGALQFVEALNIGGATTAGMVVAVVFASQQPRR